MSPPTWLITGTSSGFGLALAQHTLRAGHILISISRHATAHPSLLDLSKDFRHITHDLADPNPNTIKDKIRDLLTTYSLSVDYLVNNAAITIFGPVETFPHDAMTRMMTVNFFSPMWIIQAVLPFMRRGTGERVITNISSTQGLACDAAEVAYESSKHALEGMSGVLAKEVRPFVIRVVVVNLGSFRTEFALGDKQGLSVEAGEVEDSPYGNASHPARKRVDMVLKYAKIPDAARGDVGKGAEVVFDAIVKTPGSEVGRALAAQRAEIDGQGEMAVTMIERLVLGSDALPKLKRQAKAFELQVDSCHLAASLADAET